MSDQMDVAWIIKQQTKPLNEKCEALKSSFAQTSQKIDFIRKSDGYNYVLGELKLPGEVEYRIWKTTDTVQRSMNPEYIYKGTDLDKAREEFKNIISK